MTKQIQLPAPRGLQDTLAWAEHPAHYMLTIEHDAYPARLKEISDPPPVLFVKGNVACLNEAQIAIVGSRHASFAGLKHAEVFAQALGKTGLVVTSGLALGIDGAAHRGALLARAPTIAVLGAGLLKIYPTRHLKLAEQIVAEGGALVSEFPLNTPAYPANFPRRNRIIAGMSLGVLVVEAAMKSGSLITARLAGEQGREVFALPGAIDQPRARGCHYLIKQGAKLVETPADILEEIPFKPKNLFLDGGSPPSALSEKNRIILAQIDAAVTPLDMIILRSRLTAGEVSSMLLILELEGYIQSVPGGYRRIA